MRAYGQETFYMEMNKHVCSYTMYFPMVFNDRFDYSIYEKSVEYLLEQIPHLKRKCKAHFWRASWVTIKGLTMKQLFTTEVIDSVQNETMKEFYSRAIKCFCKMPDKTIDLEQEAPLKFKVIKTDDLKWSMIVLCVHHSIADGRGSMQIISKIGDIYSALVKKEKLPKIKNYRKIPNSYLDESFNTRLKRTFIEQEDSLAVDSNTDLIDCTNEIEKEQKFLSLEISKEKLKKLKDTFKKWNYSTNDIIVYALLQISADLLGEKANDSTVLNVGIAMDNRKHIERDITTITNYASMCPFYIRYSTLEDRSKVKEALQEFKKASNGLSFSKEFMLMALFPFAIQRKVFEGKVKNMVEVRSARGIQTTNVGEMTKFIGDYNNTLKYSEFIGPAGRFGMPILSISVYNGDMKIYFRRTNDSNNMCEQLEELLKAKLDEIVGAL